MNGLMSLGTLSDTKLIAEVARLAACERQATAHLIACLAEMDARRLYLGLGCTSLFTYCTQVLHFSEHAAYGRIEAARIARRFPDVLHWLADGSVTLTAICMLSPHLTAENHLELLAAVRHKRKRDVEHLVARLRPLPDVKSTVKKLPQTNKVSGTCTGVPDLIARTLDSRPPIQVAEGQYKPAEAQLPAAGSNRTHTIVVPLAPERYKVQFTISRETHEKLRRVQDLLRHSIPNGDPAAIFDRALTLLLENLSRTKVAATPRPRSGKAIATSRYIPAAVRRAVWRRDGGRCAFVGTIGRCSETGFLEFHHVRPFAEGGATSIENIELRCRAHNAYEAEQCFGPLFVREETPPFDRSAQLGPDRVHGVRAAGSRGDRCAAFGGPLRCGRRPHKRARRRQWLRRAARSPSQGRRRRPKGRRALTRASTAVRSHADGGSGGRGYFPRCLSKNLAISSNASRVSGAVLLRM
jgi:5-methylcytosine-specific restriction endonuclease McrA